MDNTNIFDKYAEIYGITEPHKYDYYFINTINKVEASLLDVGGGCGTFAGLVIKKFPRMDVVVIDPSQKLLDRISDKRIKTCKGCLPNKISVNEKKRFDYIHVKEVFHHIVGGSIVDSAKITKESLINLKKYLKEDGVLFVHELFYESYIIPSFSRSFIFYILKLQNVFNVQILPKEFLLGLVVCFYTRDEFKKILFECGYELIDYYEEVWGETHKKKALFLKNWGRMLFILKNKE